MCLLLSAGVAHARPHFQVTESEARAGDLVHFVISGAAGRVEYELEIGDREVLEGTGAGNVVSGEFTMPDIGPSERKVAVEAQIEESDRTSTGKRKLRYLGAAQVPAAAAPAPPVAAPADLTPPTPPPGPAPLAQVIPLPAGPAPDPGTTAGKRQAKHPARRARRQRPEARQRSTARSDRKRASVKRVKSVTGVKSLKRVKTKRAKRNAPRTAPLFDGVPESHYTPGSGSRGTGFLTPNAIVPPTAALAASSISSPRNGGDGLTAAVLAPALLALAALLVAGTALARKRRLARQAPD
jgi:hypothetical protein